MAYEVIVGRKEIDRKLLGTMGTVMIGKQYVTMGKTTSLSNPIYLDVAKAHVVFIVGKRGSGKSYSMGAIAEGIMDLPKEISQNLSMVMFDTMGIYWTMKYPNQKDIKLLDEWGIKPRGLDVQIFTPTGMFEKYKEEGVPTDFSFAIQPNELDAEDWCRTFGLDRNSEIGVLIEKVVNFLKENKEN
ncbi:ATP-binding protein [Candidatus Woesearchaeota archaeon]|nr:ATP-binding protein [Candidatus Woesearchaeota archaeon]